MICEDECGDCTVCLGLYDDDYLEEEEYPEVCNDCRCLIPCKEEEE